MAKILSKIKKKSINDKELKWFRNLLQRVLNGQVPINNIRATYKGKSEWIKVSFWSEVIRKDKEGKENGSSKATKTNSKF